MGCQPDSWTPPARKDWACGSTAEPLNRKRKTLYFCLTVRCGVATLEDKKMNVVNLLRGGVILLALGIAGCTAKPNFINGKYYMGGDSNCKRYKVLSESRIMCLTSDGEETGYRDAMTDQQLQMYQHNQQMNSQQNKTTNTNCYRTYGGGMNCTTY